ncbi:MAG TPA: S-layer homology domain-containing protein [Thermoanaerobaculia bacterium]|nr:S-layer homology domain-containing protein [Thermoanaerobaculia bacterium]
MLLGVSSALLGACGPFTDVAADVFCPFVLEIFYLGITTGTTATTYDPSSNVSRLQMAAFLSRTVDGVLRANKLARF